MGRRARNEAKVCRIALLYQATSILPNLLDAVSIQHANLGIDVPSNLFSVLSSSGSVV